MISKIFHSNLRNENSIFGKDKNRQKNETTKQTKQMGSIISHEKTEKKSEMKQQPEKKLEENKDPLSTSQILRQPPKTTAVHLSESTIRKALLAVSQNGKSFLEKKIYILKDPNQTTIFQTAPIAPEKINFRTAVQAHRAWKERLRASIEDVAEAQKIAPEIVHQDDECSLGKWLHEQSKSVFPTDEMHKYVVDLHSDFHTTAGHIAALARGRKDLALAVELIESSTSSFNVTSSALCGILSNLADAQAAFYG